MADPAAQPREDTQANTKGELVLAKTEDDLELVNTKEEILTKTKTSPTHALHQYYQSTNRLRSMYSLLTFKQTLRVFPKEPLSFMIIVLGIVLSRYISIISTALADPRTYTPPLGLSQPVFTGIVIMFSVILVMLVSGLFWAGFIAKRKSLDAANVIVHLVTFLSGALLGTRMGLE
jgi:hypothetical protein